MPVGTQMAIGQCASSKPAATFLTMYRDAGFGGMEICPIYGARGYEGRYVEFLSPRWMEMS